MRDSGRKLNEMRVVTLEAGYSPYAEGSCLVKYGNTHVLCTASVDEKVPPFLKGQGSGWVTAEYGMLPRATHTRTRREASQGKPSGRTMEIQRLIGRSLRSVMDLNKLGERQILIDCDVIQADGGTRTASITGAFVALVRACQHLQSNNRIKMFPVRDSVAAVSCGIIAGNVVVDLDYAEDSNAEVDANFVMTGTGKIVEIQSTAEKTAFDERQFLRMMELARNSLQGISDIQKQVLGNFVL